MRSVSHRQSSLELGHYTSCLKSQSHASIEQVLANVRIWFKPARKLTGQAVTPSNRMKSPQLTRGFVITVFAMVADFMILMPAKLRRRRGPERAEWNLDGAEGGAFFARQKTLMTGTVGFIVSEEAPICQSVKVVFESADLQAATFPGLQALLDRQDSEPHGGPAVHSKNNPLDEPVQQARLAAACAGRSGIVIIECGNVPTAALASKAGIRGVVQKPYRDKELLEHIANALETNAPT
jgi:hypothetical protein